MWTNICIRKIECEPDDNDDNDDEDDDDLVSTQLTTPTKVEKYSSHRVTRGSMSGVALPRMIHILRLREIAQLYLFQVRLAQTAARIPIIANLRKLSITSGMC